MSDSMTTLIGHGIDIVELASLGRLLGHSGEDFLNECFTAIERSNVPGTPHRLAYLAGRFAAKEAVMKALGTGFGDGVAFQNVEIGRNPAGAPTVQLTEGASEMAKSLGISKWLLSISHGEVFAIASAIGVGL